MQPSQLNGDRRRQRLAHFGPCLLVLLLPACQVTPSRPVAGSLDEDDGSRGLVLARQVLEDTAVRLGCEPLHTGADVLTGTASGIWMLGRELVAKRCVLPLICSPGPVDPDRPCLDPDDLDRLLCETTRRSLDAALVQMDVDGEEALRRLEAVLDSARESIDVLMYQWDSDALGWAVAQRLASRAASLGRPGGPAVVRVLVDGGGNLIHGPPEFKSAREVNEVLGWLERQPHVQLLRIRNPLACFDHRKLVLVDGRIAWSGGRNFTLASFFEYHDVSFTLEGPLVADLVSAYEEAWKDAGGPPCPRPTPPRIQDSLGCNAWARVVGTGRRRRDLSRVLYRAVDHSSHHIYLENPYFTDNILFCKLAKARKRGVDVRVVYAHDSQSGVLDRAMRVNANRLLAMGIRVYIHPGTTHVKAASVDSRWAYLGTGNFDNLSLRRNNEIGVAIGAGALIDEIEDRVFLPDFRPEWELTEPQPTCFRDYLCELLANLVL